MNRLPKQEAAHGLFTPRAWVCARWPLVVVAIGGALFFTPAPDGLHLMGVVLCPRTQNADGIARALGPRWLRVSLAHVTHGEDVVARIEDTLRRWREPKASPEVDALCVKLDALNAKAAAIATEDLLVRAQAARAERCEPFKALLILRSAARTLRNRGALTAERFASIKAEITQTKARAKRVERN
jgi:hypothetical protein